MKIVKPKTRTAKDMYKFFKKQNPDSKVVYWFFKEVLSRYNKKVSEYIIAGETLRLGSKLGYSAIRKIDRTYSKPTPNWGASLKLKNQLIKEGKTPKGPDNPNGEEWLVFYTDSYYFRWSWIKRGGRSPVRNTTVYAFHPTSNRSTTSNEDPDWDSLGNKGKLTLANRLNPVLHLRYEANG